MKKTIFFRHSWFAMAMATLILFGCKPEHDATDSGSNDLPAIVQQGVKLYEQHCSSCHREYSSSTKKKADLARIETGLTTVAAMQNIVLTSEEKELIAIALNFEIGDPEPVINNDPIAQGKALYASYCQSCHSPIDFSTKKGSTAVDISSALVSIPAMTSIASALSSEQVELIAKALEINPVAPPSGLQTPNTTFTSNKGNRRYLASVYQDIFLPESGAVLPNDQPLLNIINSHIETQVTSFGGPCRHTENCAPGITNELDNQNSLVKVLPGSSISRMGFRQRSCEEILALDRSIENFSQNIGLSLANPPSIADLAVIHDVFYPGREMTDELRSALEALLLKTQSLGFSNSDQWRFSLLPLCENAGLDLL